jgi:cellulose synthase/poly-beta-1,6-N-acetylglucosamine synthase-like glycosyltransferase
MLSVYTLPILLRPVDFLFNMKQYVIGLASYILLLPTFINVMQVYSMSNLHDISWGNRPSATAGTNMLSNDVKKQQ